MMIEKIKPDVMIEVLDILPESLNKWVSFHWASKKEYKDMWEQLIFAEVTNNKIKKIKGAVKIRLIYYFKNELRDLDNYINKGIIDGLRNTIIEEDNSKIIKSIEVTGEIAKDKIKTVIEIYKLKGGDSNGCA